MIRIWESLRIIDMDLRVKTSTLKKNVLRRRLELEALGEELHILYVAMTRAKEKLIMTGTDRYLDKKLERFSDIKRTARFHLRFCPRRIRFWTGCCVFW